MEIRATKTYFPAAIDRTVTAVVAASSAAARTPTVIAYLPAPTGLTAAAGSDNTIVVLDWADLTWPTGSTSRQYEVHEDLFAGSDSIVSTVTTSTRTSGSLRSGNYRYYIIATCTLASGALAVSLPSTKVSVTVPISGGGGPGLIFLGDYSNGNFSQYDIVQNRYYNSNAANYFSQQQYPLTFVTNDPVKGNCARFELRPFSTGEIWSNTGNPNTATQRTTIVDQDSASEVIGDIRWYAFSIKFDTGFILNHNPIISFSLTHQWFNWPGGIHPTVAFSYRQVANKWSLWIQRQGTATPAYDGNPWTVDIQPGVWHDMKMQVMWSDQDAVGFIKLWHNGVPQTFSNGSTTFPGRTMATGTTYLNAHHGIYRGAGNAGVYTTSTDVVFHTGYKMGSTEASVS